MKNSELFMSNIEQMQAASNLVSKTLGEISKFVKPGITTEKLDQIAEAYIRDHGASPSFKGYNGFPATLCTSVNEEVVHGIPSKYVLKEGDIISIDCGVYLENCHGDSAYTFPVGNISKELVNLLAATKEALYAGVAQLRMNARLGDIGDAIQTSLAQRGYVGIKEYGGHGIGAQLHQEPHIPNFGKRGNGKKIKDGYVYCIEPIVALGERYIKHENAWRVVTQDGKPAAHYEHTVAVVCGKPVQLTTFEYINPIEKKKYA